MEKTGEELTYVQGATNVTRMDYLAPLSNELVFSMAVERLLDLEIPPRATWIRMMLVELQRMASHLLFQATNGMDVGAVSMMVYGWRERELTLRFLETITGLRMNHNFIRPGGVAADLPDGWRADLDELCTVVERGVRDYTDLLSENPISSNGSSGWAHHHRGGDRPGHHRSHPARHRVPVGPPQGAALPRLRRRRLRRRLRLARRLLRPLNIRLNEILQSVNIVRQCADGLPAGDYRIQDRKVTPPPRARIDESMGSPHPPLQALHRGFRVPAGETYVAIESPRGEIGCYLVADGTGKPVRLHIRGPSFYNLQGIEPMTSGCADLRRGRDDLQHRSDHG